MCKVKQEVKLNWVDAGFRENPRKDAMLGSRKVGLIDHPSCENGKYLVHLKLPGLTIGYIDINTNRPVERVSPRFLYLEDAQNYMQKEVNFWLGDTLQDLTKIRDKRIPFLWGLGPKVFLGRNKIGAIQFKINENRWYIFCYLPGYETYISPSFRGIHAAKQALEIIITDWFIDAMKDKPVSCTSCGQSVKID